MALISKVINKVWYHLHARYLKNYGYGCRVRRDVWEREFSGDTWNYLESKDEADRYYSIIKFYSRFADAGKLLDVGCGKGVLYKYFKQEIDILNDKYVGIDISEAAVSQASKQYPGINFSRVDFDTTTLHQRFDVVIFNETLNYFNFPIKTLQRCFSINLNKGSVIIISLYDTESNTNIWKQIDKRFKVLQHDEIVNDKDQKWNVKVIAQN